MEGYVTSIVHDFGVNNIANKLHLSVWTVERCITKFEHTGDVQSTLQRHGPVKLPGDFENLLLKFIGLNKGIYLDEKLFDLLGVYYSLVTTLIHLSILSSSRVKMGGKDGLLCFEKSNFPPVSHEEYSNPYLEK